MCYICTCKVPMDTKLIKVLTYSERFPSFKQHNPLITRPTWSHVTIWKFYFFIIKRLMANKPGRVLIYRRKFSTQSSLKPLPFSWFFFSFSSVFLDLPAKFIFKFKFLWDFYFKRVWPEAKLLIWHAIWLQETSFRDKQ